MHEANQEYWDDYDGLQHAKHQLLKTYLGGWFPILASSQGRVTYIDCHAGRGRHRTGQEGSPILAIQLLLAHRQRDRILAATEVNFLLFEIDQQNYDMLKEQIDALGSVPANLVIRPIAADYASVLGATVDQLRAKNQVPAPFFAFVDPFGFNLSMTLLNELLSFPRCELLVNFMYRYVDMAIAKPSQAQNMDALFGTPVWRTIPEIADSAVRAEQAIALFSSQLKARYVSHMFMRGVNSALKYVLIHATNHKRGRELMKDALWSVTPDGSFTASERHSPNQPILILPDPDLGPLKAGLWREFAGRTATMQDMYEWLLTQTFIKKHLHRILRDYRAHNVVSCEGCEGRFAFNKNPRVTFPSMRPSTA